MRLRSLAFVIFVLLIAVTESFGARLFVRSVNDGSSGNDFHVSDITLNLTGNFTVAGWVKHTTGNFNHAQHDVLFACWGSTSSDELSLIIHGWGDTNWGKLTVVTNTADVNTGTNRPFQGNTSETHVAIRRVGSSLTFWVNGSQIATATITDSMTPSDCVFGSWGWDYFQGILWNWAIWETALSDAQIASLSHRAAPECYGHGLALSMPLITLQEFIQAATVTNNGTTSAAHPRMIFCEE